MGKRGPKPKPVAALKANGTYRQHRHGDRNENLFSGDLVQLDSVKNDPVAMWLFEHITESSPPGVLVKLDSVLLAEMCMWYSRYRRLSELLDEDPTDRHVMLGAAKAWSCFRDLAIRFSMSPSDRASLKLDPANGAVEDGAEFFAPRVAAS